MNTYKGFKVHISEPYLSVIKVERSLKERWFSLPWAPFEKYRNEDRIYETLSDNEIITTDKELIMNQRTYNRLAEELSRESKTI